MTRHDVNIKTVFFNEFHSGCRILTMFDILNTREIVQYRLGLWLVVVVLLGLSQALHDGHQDRGHSRVLALHMSQSYQVFMRPLVSFLHPGSFQNKVVRVLQSNVGIKNLILAVEP